MVAVKKIFLRSVLVVEVIVFGWFYFFGTRGMRALATLKAETAQVHTEIETLKGDIQNLKNEMGEWTHYPWYGEKIAREDLQLGFPDEEVILL